MFALVKNINSALNKSLSDERLNDQFERCWDSWESSLNQSLSEITDQAKNAKGNVHTFGEAADRFLQEGRSKDYKWRLLWVRHYIDSLALLQISDDSLALYINERLAGTCTNAAGKRPKRPASEVTVSCEIAVVRRVLNAAQEWGWIAYTPKITNPKVCLERKHLTLTPDEQDRLIRKLPEYLRWASVFAINTGVERGLLQDLEWSWLTKSKASGISYFQVPSGYSDWDSDRIIVLNSTAQAALERQRTITNDRYVFPGPRGGKVFQSAELRKAWKKANLPVIGGHQFGVANFRATFVHRLERADVTLEDREMLCWRGNVFRERRNMAPDLHHLLKSLEKIATPPASEIDSD